MKICRNAANAETGGNMGRSVQTHIPWTTVLLFHSSAFFPFACWLPNDLITCRNMLKQPPERVKECGCCWSETEADCQWDSSQLHPWFALSFSSSLWSKSISPNWNSPEDLFDASAVPRRLRCRAVPWRLTPRSILDPSTGFAASFRLLDISINLTLTVQTPTSTQIPS